MNTVEQLKLQLLLDRSATVLSESCHINVTNTLVDQQITELPHRGKAIYEQVYPLLDAIHKDQLRLLLLRQQLSAAQRARETSEILASFTGIQKCKNDDWLIDIIQKWYAQMNQCELGLTPTNTTVEPHMIYNVRYEDSPSHIQLQFNTMCRSVMVQVQISVTRLMLSDNRNISVTDSGTDCVTDSGTDSGTDCVTHSVTDCVTDSVIGHVTDCVIGHVTDCVTQTDHVTLTDRMTDRVSVSSVPSVSGLLCGVVQCMQRRTHVIDLVNTIWQLLSVD